jgi:ABC-type lipoprotein export system ATPase subunit
MSARSVPVVEARSIAKAYGEGLSQTSVLHGVDLTVGAGEIVALEGPSGSGKSTLLNVLGCLDRPSSGVCLLGGQDVSKLTREAQAWVRLHYIGFVFQSFHLLAHASALENVTLPLFYAGVPRAERERRGMALLESLGLAERASYRPSQLSGGQKQRVAIARGLACNPTLLLADEPTGALDSHTGAEILELLLSMRRTEHLTIVLVTHDASIARRADRRIVMRDGRIVEVEVEDARKAD